MNETIDNDTGEVSEPPREIIVADENLRTQITKMDKQFAAALPPHIPVERFTRVVQTALTGNPDLQRADRASLFEAALKAAQDGLLPDGRDGALVIFNTKVKRNGKDEWIKKVQWMPMVGGILKKIRNSGELLSIAAHVVYTKDKFYYCLGDNEKIEHEPVLLGGDDARGVPMCVYAIAKTKDGGIYREVMTLKDVEKVRNVSKAKDAGPWSQWWDEMARKTVIRRLAKRLPTSADLDDLLRHDDELYDFSGKRADPAPFVPVHNPLKDDVPAGDERPVKVIENAKAKDDPITSGLPKTAAPAERSETASNEDIATAKADGTVTSGLQGFANAAGEAAEAARTSEAADAKEQKTAQAASAAPANGQKAVVEKPYDDAPSYMAYVRDVLDSATVKGAVIEMWGSTRADRTELLSPEQIDELTKDKVAKLQAINLRG